MSCEERTFNNINSQVFGKLKSKLAENGLAINANSGRVSGPLGIVMEYNWDETSNSLYTKVVEKSFFVPCSQIESILEKAIRECGG